MKKVGDYVFFSQNAVCFSWLIIIDENHGTIFAVLIVKIRKKLQVSAKIINSKRTATMYVIIVLATLLATAVVNLKKMF